MAPTRRRSIFLVSAAAVIASIGLGGAIGQGLAAHDDSPRPVLNGLAALPAERLQDWVDYADAVVEAKPVGISRTTLTPEEQQAGEGLEVRLVQLSVIKQIWTSSASSKVPVNFTIAHGGWFVSDEKGEQRMYLADSVDLELGHTYLVPLTFDARETLKWQPLAPSAIQSFDNSIVGVGEKIPAAAKNHVVSGAAVRERLAGMGIPQVITALANLRMSPLVLKVADLPAVDRYQAALRLSQSPSSSPTPAIGERP